MAHHGVVQPLSRSGAPCILNCQITATTRSLRCITQISLLNLAFTFALSHTGEVTMFMVTPFTVSISICGDIELLSIGGIAPLPPDLCGTHDQIRWIWYVCAPSQLTQTVHIMVNLIDPFLHRQIFTVPPPWAATIWVRSRNCGCLVTWFCYQLIAKPGNKTAAVSWPDPYTI